MDAQGAVDGAWREHAGGMLGVLARRLGDLDRAEEALQEAVAEALRRWPSDGVPGNPSGWLVTTAWRKAIDAIRREATGRAKVEALSRTPPAAPTGDDRLALIFACCHPALPEPARMALTLNAVAGLPADAIASAFLLPRATVAQRLVRAKKTLKAQGVRVEVPPPEDLRARLAAGLAALLELHEARSAARFDPQGRLVLLEDQDRSRWDVAMIRYAVRRLGRAAALDRPGSYQLQAAIAAQHALAPSWAATNWGAVRMLYDRLGVLAPSPVVSLSRAVATGFVDGPAAALGEVDALAERLDGYRLWHATRADLLLRLGRTPEAAAALRRALALATNPAERDLLTRRLAALSAP